MPDERFEFGHLTLRFVFQETLTGGPPGDWTFSPVTEITTLHGPPLLARDSDGNCHVLVPIDDNETLDSDDKSVGVYLAAQMLTVDDELGRYVDLRCEEPDLEDEFFVLAEMALQELNSGTPAVLACRRVLERFRALLRLRLVSGVDTGRTAGLIGELLWMRQIASVNPEAALRCWQGDRGGTHDFVNGANAVEVKATLAKEGLSIAISSLDQLEASEPGTLHLYVVRLEHHPGGPGETVPGLIDSLVSLGVGRSELLNRLADSRTYHYLESDRDRFESAAYELVEEHLFIVEEGFPCLTRRQLREELSGRVTGISYHIDLVDLDQFAVETAACADVVAGFVAGLAND